MSAESRPGLEDGPSTTAVSGALWKPGLEWKDGRVPGCPGCSPLSACLSQGQTLFIDLHFLLCPIFVCKTLFNCLGKKGCYQRFLIFLAATGLLSVCLESRFLFSQYLRLVTQAQVGGAKPGPPGISGRQCTAGTWNLAVGLPLLVHSRCSAVQLASPGAAGPCSAPASSLAPLCTLGPVVSLLY